MCTKIYGFHVKKVWKCKDFMEKIWGSRVESEIDGFLCIFTVALILFFFRENEILLSILRYHNALMINYTKLKYVEIFTCTDFLFKNKVQTCVFKNSEIITK